MEKIIKQRSYNLNNCEFPNDTNSLLARIFAARNINNLDEISSKLEFLEKYNSLKDINIASKIIAKAILNNKKIVIAGDFDCDGATSTTVAILALRKLNANVDYVVPNRIKLGYGLTPQLVDEAHKLDANLIITVDNGISSIEGVQHAKSLNIDVVITDHHLPKGELPKADAIVNPNQQGCLFKSKNIAGVGVIFYTLCAVKNDLLTENYTAANDLNMAEYLDLVAIGTIADVVTLDKNNRILVSQGIARIRQNICREGIKSLFKICKKDIKTADTADIGFYVAPRINAAGRLSDMSLSVELLISDDSEVTDDLANKIHRLNDQRREIEKLMLQEALEIANDTPTDVNEQHGIVLYKQSWHQGVIGILASRIKDKFHRPTIIFSQDSNDNNILKASARSIEGYHLQQGLLRINDENKNLLLSFGGHSMAAGLSIHADNLVTFTNAFNLDVKNNLDSSYLSKIILTDGELDTQQISLNTYDMVKSVAPWGKDFPEPCFEGTFLLHSKRIVKDKHLRVSLQSICDYNICFDGFMFNADVEKWSDHKLGKVKIVYQLDKTSFRNQDELKLKISYISHVLN
jgi:single-stranded-DNA-specific exonuclease